ncbi:YSIRK signal domain/LPXTG anchor domain surface protein, partial [Streptococcus sp. HMSC073D05]|uniref:Spy0128 family protein n=3 Tax=unclassified Streptococcus TaxID=2608887 RepID=UPI0008C88144
MRHNFFETKERFSIRKYSIGVASVLLSTLFFACGSVFADEVKNNTDSQTSVVAQENQGERHKESGLEANEDVTQANTSVTPSESAFPTSQASAENSANVIKEEKTERQSNEVVAPARTSTTTAESTSPTSQASVEAPAHVVKEEKTEKQSNEVATPASTSVAPVESASPTSKANAEASSSAASEKKTEAQPTTRSRRSKRELPSSGGATTYVKTGDTITVQNPDVEVNFPNGNGLYAPAETVIHMEIPDDIEIKQNDKIVVDIPDAIRIPTSLHYDVTGPSGEVIGNAFLDSVKNKVVTTFTDYFEKNNTSKQFTLKFSTGWKSYVKPNVPTELNFSGRKITVTVGPETAPVPVEKTKVTKYGEAVTGHPELIRWTIRLNSGSLVAPQVLTNYQLIDTLPDDQELVQDGDPVLNEFDANTKATWRLGHATDIPSDHVDLWNGKALRAEKVQSISPWISKGNAIQLLENIKESSNGFSFKIAQLNELVYVRYMTRLKQVPNTNEELQQKHGNDIKITYNSGEEQSYQATFAFKADGSGSATKAKKPARVDLSFTKQLDGRKLKAGEFTFNLIDQTGQVVDSQTNDSFGHITFIPQLFNHAGVYHYTVEEVPGKLTGINYDSMKAEVTITVNDNGDSYVAQTTMPADTEFNNTFTPSPVKVNLEFNKALSNGDLNAGDFSFKLTGDNNINETVTNKADGKVTFSELSFDKVGVYNYTVKEVKGNKPDVDYDEMTVAVKVTVTKDEDSGLLTAKTEMTATGGEATGADDKTFNNHVVAPVTAQFDFTKALAGRQLKAGEFSFELVDPSDTSTDPNGKVLQTKTNDANGLVKFDALTFKNGQEGTHKYIVREVQGSLTGVTYDPMKAEVTVTVTKDGHTLTATKALPTDTEFNNIFTPTATSAQFNFTKKLEGKTLEDDAFTFELLENGHVIQTKKNKADGTIQFDTISYDKEGTHTYTVREVAGTDTDIDYDTMNAEVTVNVTKNATTGVLTANVTMPADSEFNNYAVAPVTAQFDFSKVLAGRTLKDGEFSFVLKDASGQVLQTKTNDASGKVAFDALTYKNNEVGVHKYTVEEVAGSEAGMTYDPMKAEVTVTVTKDGHTLTATKALPTDTEFNNIFTPTATSAQFNFTKKLEGKTLEADAFTFELLENGNVIQTKKNKADGTIQFDAISFDKEGTHTYTVREVAGTDTDIDYDSMTTTVIVTVTKDATTGLLSAKTEMTSTGGEATGTDDTIFNNYFVAPVKAQFNFTKKLEGRELKAGEFSFVLKDEKGNVIETVTNNADGKIQFSPLTFKRGEEGTYVYHVEEVKGTEAGVIFDHMIATVGITVKKDGKVLTATTQLPEDTEFNNTVIPPTPPTPPTPS